jgi:hypothetical protein
MFETARRYIRLISICYLFKDPVIWPDTVVGIVTDYGSIPMIFLLQSVSTAFGDHPSSFVVVKLPGREADYLRSTRVTNGWTRTLLLLLLLLLTANEFIPGGSVLQCKTGQYSTVQYNTLHYTE